MHQSTFTHLTNNPHGVFVGNQILALARDTMLTNPELASHEVAEAGRILLGSICASDRMGRYEARQAIKRLIWDSVDREIPWSRDQSLRMLDAMEAID